MTTEEYRKIMDDNISTDEKIQERIKYIEALCKKVIDSEIEEYLSKK